MRFPILVVCVVLLFGGSTAAQEESGTDLSVALYPYLPDAESAAERLEAQFEAFAKSRGVTVDVDFALVDTYGDGITAIGQFDIAEIDLCMFDRLVQNDVVQLDEVPEMHRSGDRTWIGPADSAMKRPWAKHVLPHWVCGNFLVHWSSDAALCKANTFEQLIAALEPDNGRHVFADLWGGGTLGEFYADAVLDLYGPDEARKHFADLAGSAPGEVRAKLRAEAVLAIWRLTKEMQKEHLLNRSHFHDLSFVYPRAFACESDSCLLGYSERLHFAERALAEQPWLEQSIPMPTQQLVVRQLPFSDASKGTPTWVDAFVIPKGKYAANSEAIELFLDFVTSDDGYRCFLEPRQYYPGAYLLPALASAYESSFVKEKLPMLNSYRECVDGSFPMIDQYLYRGVDAAGEQLKEILASAAN